MERSLRGEIDLLEKREKLDEFEIFVCSDLLQRINNWREAIEILKEKNPNYMVRGMYSLTYLREKFNFYVRCVLKFGKCKESLDEEIWNHRYELLELFD